MALFRRKASATSYLKMLEDTLNDGKEVEKTDPEKSKLAFRRLLRYVTDADVSEVPIIAEQAKEISNFLIQAGEALYNLEDKEKAIDCLEKAKELDTKNASSWYAIGKILVSQNMQLPYALICLKEAVAIDPSNVNAWILLGDVYRLQDDRDRAMTIYQEALKVSEDKLDILGRILKLDPNNKEALLEKINFVKNHNISEDISEAYVKLSELEKDLKYVEEGLQTYPENLGLFVQKAKLLMNQDKDREAQQILDNILKKEPKNVQARLLKDEVISKISLESLKVERKRETLAEEVFGDMGLEKEKSKPVPMPAPAVKKDAGAEQLQKDIVSGAESLEEDLERFKRDVGILPEFIDKTEVSDDTLKRIVDVLVKQKNFGIANMLVERIKDPLVKTYLIGYISFGSGEYEVAEKSLNEVLKLNMNHALTWYLKAAIMAQRQNESAFRNFLTMAFRLDPQLKERALTDRHFKQYKNMEWFKKMAV